MAPRGALFATLAQAAAHVATFLGAGHSESVYHSALLVELCERAIVHRSEVICPFLYGNQCVGYGKADIVIGDVILELKALGTTQRIAEHHAQLQRYMESLSGLEDRPFVGAVLVVDKGTAETRLQAIDSGGRVLYDTAGSRADVAGQSPGVGGRSQGVAGRSQGALDEEVLTAFRRRYRFVRSSTVLQGVRQDRLLAHLHAVLGNTPEKTRAVTGFVKRVFHCRRRVSRAQRGDARRLVVCFPRDGSGVVPV